MLALCMGKIFCILREVETKKGRRGSENGRGQEGEAKTKDLLTTELFIFLGEKTMNGSAIHVEKQEKNC
jgi:hypothetical protein